MACKTALWATVLAVQLASSFVHGLSSNAQPLSATSPTSGTAPSKTIIEPNQPFRDTKSGEVSIVSFNALAPTLHALCQPLTTREEYEMNDREQRVPAAFQIAKRLNGDVLCLQEVEGGPEHETALELMLSSSEAINGDGLHSKGYDSYVWSPLHPHRPGEVVGLCVAWRSDKHTLVSSSSFRRGLVVQLEEKSSGATFSIGNLHLPARPADIFGRLKAVATACRRIEDNRSTSSHTPLDGATIMVGDFNCDTDSSPIHLLKHGLVSPGILFERNYRHKLTKTNAYKLRHGLRFLDAYGDALRKSVASVTVSLHGRGPGSMDHVLFSPGKWGRTHSRKRKTPALGKEDLVLLSALGGKRSRRRHRVQERVTTRVESKPPALLRAEAVLATIDPNDTKRTTLIASGLPHLEKGFPSDHLPVGVLLSPLETPSASESTEQVVREKPLVTPNSIIKRGDAHTTRQRHNALVRAISAWLMQRGAVDFIKDEPLYKWKWVDGANRIKRNMRAPDICCVAPLKNEESVNGGTLLMVEVTVANRPQVVRKQKEKKYNDLSHMLSSTTKVLEAEMSVPSPFVVVVSDTGDLPIETIETLESLAQLTCGPKTAHGNNCANIANELLLIRNHWTCKEAV